MQTSDSSIFDKRVLSSLAFLPDSPNPTAGWLTSPSSNIFSWADTKMKTLNKWLRVNLAFQSCNEVKENHGRQDRKEGKIVVCTCLFCHFIYAFLSGNSLREIQHSNSSGIKRVSIRFPTFPVMAFKSPLLVLMSAPSEICR